MNLKTAALPQAVASREIRGPSVSGCLVSSVFSGESGGPSDIVALTVWNMGPRQGGAMGHPKTLLEAALFRIGVETDVFQAVLFHLCFQGKAGDPAT